MKQNIIEMIQEFLAKRAKNKLLRKFVFTLAVFVVFCTTYALILPAISIDKETSITMPGIDMQSNASVASTEPEITEDSPIENTETSTEAVASSTENTEEKQNLDGVYEKAQEDYSVSVTVPEKAEIPSESELYLEPVSDDDSAYLKKVKSLFKGERIKKAVFFDMGFANEGQDQEPQSAVNVTLQMKDKINGKLVHFTEDDVEIVNAEIKHLKPTKNTEEDFQTNISFATDSFSVYGVVETTLEDSILTSDGKNYKISVTYKEDAQIPENAKLSVSEVKKSSDDYNSYVSKAEDALGWKDSSYIRLFDIKILDEKKEKIEIAAPVDVKIELEGKEESKDTQVVHFEDESHIPNIIEHVESQKEKEGVSLSFATSGFSVYAIVEAPEPANVNIQTIENLTDISPNEPFLFSVTRNGANNYYTNNLNNNNAFVITTNILDAAEWYFEPISDGHYYIYTYKNSQKYYIKNTSGNLAGLSLYSENAPIDATAFEVTDAGNSLVYLKIADQNKWLQYSNGGGGMRFWADVNNASNSKTTLTYASSLHIADDPYELNGETFGIAYNDNTATAAALSTEINNGKMVSDKMVIKPDVLSNQGILLVSKDADIAEWTFESVREDKYYLTTMVGDTKKYLTITNSHISLEDEPDDVYSVISATPGTNARAGKWHLSVNGYALNLTGNQFNAVGNNGATTWLNFVKKSTLTNDDFVRYSAQKVSISDTEKLKDGQQVIIYTRVWNNTTKKYEFYAVDHDGSLIYCYDKEDNIEWIGSRINTALWTFTEYHNEDGTPNYYYELQNVQYGNYISPQITGNQLFSEDAIGINLTGRRFGENYSTIVAWDDENYSYAGLKTSGQSLVSAPVSEAQSFYFALINPIEYHDELSTIDTVDNEEYGITMKMVDFTHPNKENSRDTVVNAFFGGDQENKSGILSTNLDENGYPMTTNLTGNAGHPLSEIFNNMTDANHLFVKNVYSESGYFEYDSTQNFAHLQEDGNFKLYNQIGAIPGTGERKVTRTHGQFMPYDDITEGEFAIGADGQNITNETDVLGNPLPDIDPRKGEKLYKIADTKTANYFFGMEMEASFTQTVNGLDAWNHDIVFEFSGDDDFWLYVDGELALDLGGIHSAQVGSINFKTGEIKSSRGNSTLYNTFKANYIKRGLSQTEINTKLDEIFTRNEQGKYVFKDFSQHTMKMFYMERGASASNLRMRFNLASVKPGTFILKKELGGTDNPKNNIIEFPYQVYYYTEKDGGTTLHRLGENPGESDKIFYKDSNLKVKYKRTFTPYGGNTPYKNVFFLKPGESAVFDMPEGVIKYYVVECGIDPSAYDKVLVNGEELTGTPTANPINGTYREDYTTSISSLEERPRVNIENQVNENAMRTLTISKKLFDSDGITPLHYPADPSVFNFRLYLGNENDTSIELAHMQPYFVKDPGGNYCKWDATRKKFVSLGKTQYETLTDSEKESAQFLTSMYGAISKIPSDYTIEVRELIIGSQYKIEERDSETPKGYKIRLSDGYTRTDVQPVQENGNTPISGRMMQNDSPKLEVRNQKGWGLTVEKKWSDDDFMESHDDIYFAVYLNHNNTQTLIPHTVRRLKSPKTSVYYFFDNLENGIPFNEYVVKEVVLTGDNIQIDEEDVVTGYASITPLENDNPLTVGGKPVGQEYQPGFQYSVEYQPGELTTQNSNIRNDVVKNHRPGLAIYKQDMSGHPLQGIQFTLRNMENQDVGSPYYISDNEGFITTAYLPEGTYTLTETKIPKGYQAFENPITLNVDADGDVSLSGIDNRYYTKSTEGENISLILKNKTASLQLRKIDHSKNTPLGNVHFALYRQLTDVHGNHRKDYEPMPGYEDIITNAEGLLPEINMHLNPATYYLTETTPAPGYGNIPSDLCFTIHANGTVSIETEEFQSWLQKENADDTVSYLITIPNDRLKDVSIWKTDVSYNTIPSGASFALYKARDFDDEIDMPIAGKDPIITGTTNAQGILSLGSLEYGEYRLVETSSPAGYNPALSSIKLLVGESVSAMQGNSASFVCQKGDPYWVNGQSDSTWQIRVWNNPGLELPATGGMGTKWFYYTGFLLILLSVILYFKKQKQIL